MSSKKKAVKKVSMCTRESEFGSNGSSKFIKIIGDAGNKGVTRVVICNIARTRALLGKKAPNTGLNWAFSMAVAGELIRKQNMRNEKTGKLQRRGAPYVLTAKGKELYKRLKAA